ncbi:MAG TPA: TIGR03435 family protein [Terriglobia bacterium]|nr:TIGR03435 family protein [Terriglobia bacterium]
MPLISYRVAKALKLIPHLLAVFGITAALGQTPQAQLDSEPRSFEVASVRSVPPEELRTAAAKGFTGIMPCSGSFELTPGRIRIVAVTVFRLIATAYGQPCAAALDLKLIAGGPDWIQKTAFHIQATLPSGTPDYSLQQLQNGEAPVLETMLRNLMADRFHLAVTRSMKEASIYNIYSAKEGRVKLSVDQTPTQLSLVSGSRGNFDMALDRTTGIVRLVATAIPISRLIAPMQGRDGRIVFDRTGMTGVYDIAPTTIDVGPSAPGVSVWPEIMQALGFRIESARGPVEFLRIDRLDRPSEN